MRRDMPHRLAPFGLLALLLCACVPAPVAQGPDGLETPAGYTRLFAAARHNFRFVSSSNGEPVRLGARAERYELRDGDCGGSDCGQARYRTEVQETPNRSRARIGEEIWYGWSFYNATIPAFQRSNSLRLVLGQWTTGGGAAPAIRLIQLGRDEGNWSECSPAICTGPNLSDGDVVIQLEDLKRRLNWGEAQNNGYVCRLFDSQRNRNKWVDITMSTNFSPDLDGFLRVWVNGTLTCDYSGPILSKATVASGTNPTHRRGIFASYTKRWDAATNSAAKPTLIAYYDEFRSGTSRNEVEVGRRARSGRRPLD